LNEQDRLRKEIAKAHKSVTNKINRTKRQTGANVAGSEFDPRKRVGSENRMRSTSNMREYLANLKGFMSPANQFISGQNGAPLRKGYFLNIYKKNEQAVEAVRNQRDKAMGDLQTPTGLNIRQQTTSIPQAGGSAVHGPYKSFDRQASDIKSMEALEKLNADMVKRLKPNYLSGQIGKGRDNIETVADYLGQSDILDGYTDDDGKYQPGINDLSDDEFDKLWFGTNFADRLFLYYELSKERLDGTHKERKQDRIIETQFEGIGGLIRWAKDPDAYFAEEANKANNSSKKAK
jgi:hypothetical protein